MLRMEEMTHGKELSSGLKGNSTGGGRSQPWWAGVGRMGGLFCSSGLETRRL